MRSRFVPTQFSTAADKEKFCANLVRFLSRGCRWEDFYHSLYNRLSMLFHHIAHYNRVGFYDTWFKTPRRQLIWVQRVLNHTPIGDPTHTWSDAERAIAEWLRKEKTLLRKLAEEVELEPYKKDLGIARELAALRLEIQRRVMADRETS